MRILLLNPPGCRTYIRDYFCSKTTKSNYLFHPIDLVILSGTLAEEHDISVLDCMAERLGPEAAEERISSLAPEVLISLVGSVSWDEDRPFLAGQAAQGRRVIAIGDVLHENSLQRLADEPWLEAALHVFSNRDAVHYLANERDQIQDMTVRDDSGTPLRISDGPAAKRRGSYRVPRPRHELFPDHGYHFSFARKRRFATVLTDYGCPYPCTFCVIGTLGFQTRPVEDVLEEIDALRSRGVTELFVMDQTFGVDRPRGLELCAAFEERGDLSWTAFTRPDRATEEMLRAMQRAGCHTVIMGVESADDELLATYRKGYRASEVGAAFQRAHAAGMRTVGTFIIGLPEETQSSLEATLKLAIELEMDFMSINVAVPRFGTPFRAQVMQLGLANAQDLVMDQGGADAFLPTNTLDRAQMLRLKKRMVRRFYLRPTYLLRRLAGIRSLYELRAQVREGVALLSRNTR
ncbi:MAG: anaerobic magnesium-protoporphyrin IX monomethyl ester cyclase [Planctomycetota bacterium]|jgi:anaerobic magnesium-protoporphyrin IX monomethyl ester cyclase